MNKFAKLSAQYQNKRKSFNLRAKLKLPHLISHFLLFLQPTVSTNSLGDAIQFLRDFDREAAEMCNRVANGEWRYSTNSTDYNKRKMREQQNLASKFECLSWRRASMFDTSRILDSNTRRQLGRIVTQGRCGLGDERYREITHLITTMKDNYNNVKICPYRGQSPNIYSGPYEFARGQSSRESYVTAYTGFCDLRLDPDLNRIMENSRLEPELRYVWTAFRDKTGPPIKNTFMRYLDLANQAAEKHGECSHRVFVFLNSNRVK